MLPAETLAEHCYAYMFYGCHSLKTAPELPAMTLVDLCYFHMFDDCDSLVNAPALPAETLADRCYNSMFYSCDSLVTAPSLPAIKLANGCYSGMFYGCEALTVNKDSGDEDKLIFICPDTSDFIKNPVLHMFTGTNGDHGEDTPVTDTKYY